VRGGCNWWRRAAELQRVLSRIPLGYPVCVRCESGRVPRISATRVTCPRPEHAGSRVKLDGTYGKPGHRRQRYQCSPRGGDKPHVFTELLPREESWHDSCEQCERRVERREGPKAPRNCQFVARGIAEALEAVGAGSTYMRASRVARDRARRFRVDAETGELRESAHGQLVADWVELLRQSCSSLTVPPLGRRRARCCLIICRSGSEPWMGTGDGSRPVASRSMFSVLWATGPAGRGSGVQRRSRARIPPTGARSWARCRAARRGLCATPTAGWCRRSRSCGPTRSATNANGTFSMRWNACWPRS